MFGILQLEQSPEDLSSSGHFGFNHAFDFAIPLRKAGIFASGSHKAAVRFNGDCCGWALRKTNRDACWCGTLL